MQVELEQVTTDDGILLSGAFFKAWGERFSSIDALVFFHGDGGHFYHPLYLGLGEALAARGINCLLANRRGHDLVAHGMEHGPLAGYAFESVADSVSDFRAWLQLMAARRCERVAIGGHSGGAVRAVYAKANGAGSKISAVVSISPGEYRHETVLEQHSDAFREAFDCAQQDISDGVPETLRVPGLPWGSMWSSGAYVDCFNRDDRYSVSAHAAKTDCPTLFVFGARECDGPERLPVCDAARARIADANYVHVTLEVVSNANHGYDGEAHRLYTLVGDWLQGIGDS